MSHKYLILLLCAALLLACGKEKKEKETSNSTQTIVDTVSVAESESSISEDEEHIEEKAEEKTAAEGEDDVEILVLDAYVFDPDDQPTNVRDGARGNIVMRLEKNDSYELMVMDGGSGWFMVKMIMGEEREYAIPGAGIGYIHGSILAVDTRNYGGETIYLYAEASKDSEVVATIDRETQFTLKATYGRWVKVRWDNNGNPVEGWVESEWLCGSLKTMCS